MYAAGIIGTGGVAGMGILGRDDPKEIGTTKVDTSHAGGYEATDEIELVAVADVDREKLDTFGKVWNIPEERRYLGHETMLEEEDLDVVSVCTPTLYHHEHVIDAVQIGDPTVVWSEKPLAASVTDGEAMIHACEETDTELVINHSSRFQPKYTHVRELLRDGLLGDVYSVHGTFRMELLRNSTHLLDTLVYWLDARPERISGYITGENEAMDALGANQEVDDAGGGGTVVMTDGTFVTVDCTVPRADSTMYYSLIGSEGKLYLNPDDNEWRYWRLTDDGHIEEPLPGFDALDAGGYAESFADAVSHIVDLIDGETTNRSPGHDALRSVEIITGFYLSHYTGAQVTVPLARPLRDTTIRSW